MSNDDALTPYGANAERSIDQLGDETGGDIKAKLWVKSMSA